MGSSKFAIGRVILLGAGHVFNRLVSLSITLSLYYILRFLFTLCVLGSTNKLKGKSFKVARHEIKYIAASSVLMLVATFFFYESMKYLNPSAIAVFDLSSTIVISILLALALTSEKLTKQKAISFLIISIGLIVCCISTYMRLGSLIGVLLTVIVGVANALTNLIINKVQDTDKDTYYFFQNVGLLILSILLHLVLQPEIHVAKLAGSYIFTGLVLMITALTSLYGNLFVIYSIKEIGIVKTNIILSVVPITSTIALALFFKDSIQLDFAVGMCVITYGLVRWYRKS